MWFNPIMEWVLKSPLQGMLSGNTMIMQYIGRKSGKTYHLPVGYLRIYKTLVTVSFKRRTWWRGGRRTGTHRSPCSRSHHGAGHLKRAREGPAGVSAFRRNPEAPFEEIERHGPRLRLAMDSLVVLPRSQATALSC